MTESEKRQPWSQVVAQALLTTLLTTALTLGGSLWLEERKAKIELAKEVSQKQADALDRLDRDLTKLGGNIFFIDKLATVSNSGQAVQQQAIEAATVMADIYQDNKPLDDSFQAKRAIHDLAESLAPVLANLSDHPSSDLNSLDVYYQKEFIPKLTVARGTLDNDHKRVVTALR